VVYRFAKIIKEGLFHVIPTTDHDPTLYISPPSSLYLFPATTFSQSTSNNNGELALSNTKNRRRKCLEMCLS
jgi:hypothetical protein